MRKPQRFVSFDSNVEYLSSTLEYLSAVAEQRIAEQGRYPNPGGALTRPDTGREGGSTAAEDRLAADKVGQNGPPVGQARRRARQFRKALDARVQSTISEGKTELPLEALARQDGLCDFEKMTLATILGWGLDNHFKQLLAAMSGCRHSPEVRILLDLLCDTLEERIVARKYFVSSGNLIAKGLLCLSRGMELGRESNFMGMGLELTRQISSYLLGDLDVSEQLVSFSSIIEPQVELDQIVLPPGKKAEVLSLIAHREQYLARRQAWGLDRILPYGKGMVILFSGSPGTGKTLLAHALARATGHRLMLVDLGKINGYGRRQLDENLRGIFREARLRNAIIFFDEADELFGVRCCNRQMPTLLREIERLDGICILATNQVSEFDEAMDRRITYRLEFERPPAELREEIWHKHLPETLPLAKDVDVKALAEEFNITGGLIKNAVLVATRQSIGPDGEERPVSQEDLRKACLALTGGRLGNHADKVAPRVALGDVVLPAHVRAQVEDVINAARQRSTVFKSWGFAQKMSLGKALTVLLTGESGVGKTMTAEAIANELGQTFYVIRPTAIVSSWVGQTEKNLDSVFEEARAAKTLLFFDEADALFSARLDEPSHHAHYINQQINTLLRAIEQFDGIVILATNRPAAFDAAFERRIRYRINLPRPEAAVREAIWRRLLPTEAPVAPDIDFASLAARHEFTGGTIRNVLLRAAFAAANDGRVITQELLDRCAEEESPLQPRREIGFVPRRPRKSGNGELVPDQPSEPVAVESNGGGE
jgi:SpoVK/Ycf46/Vps4 family AAA+-type ATPase